MKIPAYSVIFIILGFINVHSQSDYQKIFTGSGVWNSETLYVGPHLTVRAMSFPVIISRVYSGAIAEGALYLMSPEQKDSTIFLFHNLKNSYPDESDTINLGRYPAGTKLTFMYKVTDSSPLYDSYKNIQYYSGPGRIGTDEYINTEEGLFNGRWAAAGRIDSNTIELGFDIGLTYSFLEIIVNITGVFMEEIEKAKTPVPIADPQGGVYANSINVNLYLETVKEFEIYYSTDGADPDINSMVYSVPINVTTSTTIKTFAQIYNDTNWTNSDIVSHEFIIDTSLNVNYMRNRKIKINPYSTPYLYTIKGQKLHNNYHKLKDTLPAGIFIEKNSGKIGKLKYFNNIR